MKKVFKDFLNKYYKESLVRKKDVREKDFVSKVNDCVVSVYNKYSDKQITSRDVILPTGCYSMMLETEDKNVFTKCLSVLPNMNDLIVGNIKNCIQGTNITCTNGVTFEIEKEGELMYTDCCGNNTITNYGVGIYDLKICIINNSLRAYDKNGKPVVFKNITYDGLRCRCIQNPK